MTKTYYEDFKSNWLEIYTKQYKEYKTNEERKAIKDNIYKNVQLTTQQKDFIWELIVRKGNV